MLLVPQAHFQESMVSSLPPLYVPLVRCCKLEKTEAPSLPSLYHSYKLDFILLVILLLGYYVGKVLPTTHPKPFHWKQLPWRKGHNRRPRRGHVVNFQIIDRFMQAQSFLFSPVTPTAASRFLARKERSIGRILSPDF